MAKVVVFVIVTLALLAYFMSGTPAYFSCSGKMTANGSDQSQIANELSFKTEMVPWLNSVLFKPDYLGIAAFDSHKLYLHVFDVTDVNVMVKSASGGKALGVFDRVSRRLMLNDGAYAYDVICKPTESIKI
jgi:hypothetical protein